MVASNYYLNVANFCGDLSWNHVSSSFPNAQWLNRTKDVLILGTGLAGLYLTWKVYTARKKAERRKKWASVGKDVVVLHQFPRARFTPSISPFVLKLETYLRMTGIPYQTDFTEPFGPKGKMPWMTLNGEHIADSQICLELLARKFNKNFSSHLTSEEQAVSRAMQIMVEEHLLWVGVLFRFVYRGAKDLPLIQPNLPLYVYKIVLPLIATRKWKKAAYGQGIGRHSQAEVIEMGFKDLRALSRFLGTKPFFMGDKPTELDCTMFGLIAQMLWNFPESPYEQLMDGEFANLKNYAMRMKETFWPDWDRCLAQLRN